MADAYEDVGLTVANHGDPSAYCSVSHVNDTFGSENYTSNAKHKGNILESCERVTLNERVDYESLGAENADLACDVDPVFNCLVEQADFCATEAGLQKEGFSVEDITTSQTILRSNERQDKMTNLVPDRFQSRWFGGWTSKVSIVLGNTKTALH
ncbi:uncharacterized protein LOC143608419 isoform X1 [Bidens hawaiensis]|uniref:uncharacterized protein LOC143608419 isoform X1 n=1 Tax=Bidens hawaiensis TaxID=980011 RepID=UPI00404B8ED0